MNSLTHLKYNCDIFVVIIVTILEQKQYTLKERKLLCWNAVILRGVPKKYTDLKSYIFVLRTNKSLTFVSFVGQDLSLNFET